MVSHAGTGGVRPFLQLLEVQALRGAADRDLLSRVADDDEAAFRVVAERHGPMVFGVCARVLGNRHDAEDALQATFLVLARRAAAVRKSESLASWLHGVARRVALRLRRATRRRAAREQAAAVPDAHAPADALAWAEVRAGLDEELARLPAAYRDVLVLCYLEGLSRDEAAQRLGLDPGAVKGRLERGRRLLGERLVKRGIGLSAGLAALAVAPEATAALRLGRLAADPAAASPRAVALTHEFLKGVVMFKFKLVTAGVVGVMVLAVGVGTAQPPAPVKEPPPAAPAPGYFKIKTVADKDTDEAYIRRVSRDLRGTDPTPAEVHFFLASKDAGKRATLVDLFVKERTDKAAVREANDAEAMALKLKVVFDGVRREDMLRRMVEAERATAERAAREAVESQRWAAERVAEGGWQRLEAARLLREAQLKKEPTPSPPPPVKTSDKGFRDVENLTRPAGLKEAIVPATPAVAPAAAANVEVLRVRLKLAEVTVREKVLLVRETEDQAKVRGGVVPAAELARVRLEVERAELQLLEARLTLEQAERSAPRSAPPAARP